MSKTELQAINQRNSLALWSAKIEDCRNSGMTVAQWCAAHHIPKSTYYTWQRKVFHALSAENTFVEIQAQTEPAEINAQSIATISVSGITAEIHGGADEATIAALLRAMKSC